MTHAEARPGVARWLPLLAIGGCAVMAYELALHIWVLHTIEPGAPSDGLAVVSVVAGAPVAAAWAVALVLYARRRFGAAVSDSALLWAVAYTIAVGLAFVGYGTLRDKNAMTYLLGLIVMGTFPALVALPLTMGLLSEYEPWKLLVLVAVGVPSVGPMFLLVWLSHRAQEPSKISPHRLQTS